MGSFDASRAVVRGVVAMGALCAAFVATTWTRGRFGERPSFAEEANAPSAVPSAAAPSRGGGATPLPPAKPTTIATRTGALVHVYPPFDARLRRRGAPLVLMLHGMGGDPAGTCDFWSDEARASSWLACPSGNTGCCGAFDWKGAIEDKAAYLDEIRGALRDAMGPAPSTEPPILIGFSRGAFVARDVIYARPGVYDAAIFIGAALNPDPVRLKAAGIRRVVLASGDFDGARTSMVHSAKVLEAAGLPARFVSLGRIPHALPSDLGPILQRELAWLREGSPDRT